MSHGSSQLRLRIVTVLIVGLLAAAAAATGLSATASARTRLVSADAALPRAELTSFSCVRSAQPFFRRIAATAVMRPVPGTKSMQTDFELLERVPESALFTAVRGPNLWQWLGPETPTLGQRTNDVWNDEHSVNDLAAPARYKFVVLFRWRGLHGRVIRRMTRTSAVCVQRVRRPMPTTTTTTTGTSTTTTSTTSSSSTSGSATTLS